MGRVLIERAALVDRVLPDSAAVTLVRAPAGYGKTILLAQAWRRLEARGERALWWSLQRADVRPERLLSHLRGMLSESGSAWPEIPCDDPEHAGDELADQLAATDERVTIFLDNAQVLAGSASLLLIQALVRQVSDRLRLVIATRCALPLPLAKLRAQGQLAEIGVAELAFNEVDAATLLAQFGCDWPGAWCSELHRRCEGWVTGLQLLGQCLAQAPQTSGAARLDQCTGELPALAEYFDQEVMQPLMRARPELKDFLLQVCVLDLLSPSLCEAVTLREDGQALLMTAIECGALMGAEDAQAHWYRMNGLFAQYLRRCLSETAGSLQRQLHQRASLWLQGERRFVAAFEHAVLADEHELAAQLFEREILDAWCAGAPDAQRVEVLTMCARIPADIKQRYPRILLLEAWRRGTFWQFDGARELIDGARGLIAQVPDDARGAPGDMSSLQGLLDHAEAMFAQLSDNHPQAELLCEAVLRNYPQANPYLKCTCYVSLLSARREQYKLGQFERLAALAEEYGQRSGPGPGLVFVEAAIAPTFMMVGRTEVALRRLNRAMEQAEGVSGGRSELPAILALLQAEVHYERNEMDQAQALIDHYLPHGAAYGFVDQLIAGWSVASRLHQAHGEADRAESVLHDALSFARMRGFDRLRLHAVSELVRLLTGQGRLDEVARLARDHQIDGASRALLPSKGATSRDEAQALAWTRIAMANNHLAEAQAVAKHWRHYLEATGAVRPLLRWEILMAHQALLAGDNRAAQRLLRRAIALALPGRFMRSFLDEGAWLEGLLRKQAEAQAIGQDLRCDAFAAELITAFDVQHGRRKTTAIDVDNEALGGVYGALNPREVEILSLVAGGLLNREIGERIGMTEGSIKWYLQRIYDKLGVRRRSQAMDRAIKMGIITG